MSILYKKALLMVQAETTFRTDPGGFTSGAYPDFVAVNGGINGPAAVLINDPLFAVDATILDRDNVKIHISSDPGVAGRKIATVSFSHEVRGNGVITGATQPRLGLLLRGCGMSATAVTSGDNTQKTRDGGGTAGLYKPTIVGTPTGVFTFAKTGSNYIGALPRTYILTCVIGGATGVRAFAIHSPAVGQVQSAVNVASQVMPDTTSFALSEGATITPTFTTDPVAGDTYIIRAMPYGWYFKPVSSGFESLTFHMYYDGLRHIMSGSRGTFTVEGEAGNFASFNFTFTGDFQTPTDQTIPTTATYETIIPPQVELANIIAAGTQFDNSPVLDSTSGIDGTAETITIANHGLQTGAGPFRVITVSGALPTGLVVATDYWVIRVDTNTISLASSRANSLAGTAIGLTAAVGTFRVVNSSTTLVSGKPSASINAAATDLCAQSFNIDIGNEITPRECINEKDALGGALIVDRNSTAGFNPETELEQVYPFWGNLDRARKVTWGIRIGSEQGNIVGFYAPYSQFSNLPYADRNGTRTYDVAMRLATDIDNGGSGNDELEVTFS